MWIEASLKPHLCTFCKSTPILLPTQHWLWKWESRETGEAQWGCGNVPSPTHSAVWRQLSDVSVGEVSLASIRTEVVWAPDHRDASSKPHNVRRLWKERDPSDGSGASSHSEIRLNAWFALFKSDEIECQIPQMPGGSVGASRSRPASAEI